MKKIILLLIALLLFSSCSAKRNTEIIVEPDFEEVTEDTIDKSKEEEYALLNKNWDDNYAITHDYVGELTVGKLFTYSFVQGESNDTYLRRDWYTMNYDEEGSIFMDFRNEPDDQNLIIYGHYVYKSYEPSGTHKFTPLRLLKEEENYEENKYITLQLENEIRTYEIACVFYVDTYLGDDGIRYTQKDLEYYYTNYEDDYLKEYLKSAKKASFYDTGVDIDTSDYFLTLQTCVENEPELREIVLAKLISTERTR